LSLPLFALPPSRSFFCHSLPPPPTTIYCFWPKNARSATSFFPCGWCRAPAHEAGFDFFGTPPPHFFQKVDRFMTANVLRPGVGRAFAIPQIPSPPFVVGLFVRSFVCLFRRGFIAPLLPVNSSRGCGLIDPLSCTKTSCELQRSGTRQSIGAYPRQVL